MSWALVVDIAGCALLAVGSFLALLMLSVVLVERLERRG